MQKMAAGMRELLFAAASLCWLTDGRIGPLTKSSAVMRGLDPRIHLLEK
ncbi:MAG: hypothetical protein M9932_16495 [Xanthobacteraceae bacterium]|nr:hypothetical protein [Xanthobacteraceae bacterium]